jgi:hypothetical protein
MGSLGSFFVGLIAFLFFLVLSVAFVSFCGWLAGFDLFFMFSRGILQFVFWFIAVTIAVLVFDDAMTIN